MSGSTVPPHPEDLAQVERLIEHVGCVQEQVADVQRGIQQSHRLATLGTIATIIAHEYNNILTPVVSYAQMALDRPDDRELHRKALEKALAGAERAARISNSLMGFAGEDTADDESAELEAVLDEALACLGREPERDGITLERDIEPARLAINPLNLQQILLNLLLNARKAMRGTGGKLRVAAEHDHRSGLVRIELADTGPGIPLAIRDRLFEPFVTCETAPRHRAAEQAPARNGVSEKRGTGLGLCICKDLVERAGGRIDFESELGKGTTFIIWLPAAYSA